MRHLKDLTPADIMGGLALMISIGIIVACIAAVFAP